MSAGGEQTRKAPFRGHRAGAGKHEAILEGVIQHHGRFAFLLTETEGGSDVFLRGRGLDMAMDGDRVQARVRSEKTGRLCGEIIRVIKRARTSIVGILKHARSGWAVFPEKGDAPPAQVTGFCAKAAPREGALAVLEVTRWPTVNAGAAGRVIEVLGDTENVQVRITALLRARGISEDFPEEVLAQSAAFPASIEPSQREGREELFHLPVVTIDGADARDFDDAVSLERLDGGMVRLGVHIADVGHYVKAGASIDKEAYTRGTSVYLPDRVVPMLPPALSNELCSLVPGQERLTLSVFMDISPSGKLTRRRMAQTVIRSCRRFTYEEVQTILDGGNIHAVTGAVAGAVRRMGALAAVLYEQRLRRGALDFTLPEYKVETDSHGKPIGVVIRPRLQSHRLIEEFMLLANEAVATGLMAAKAPFLHRRHDPPDPAKLKALAKELGNFGLSAGHILGGNAQKGLQDVLRRAERHPLADIINSLIVRSMKQAVYSPASTGHFGIAARAYTHFTSPIRRYPDLMTHRAVKAFLRGKKENYGGIKLDAAGVHCSERERAAADAENKAVDIMRAELFKRKIGAVMDGTVTKVIDSGAFVLLGDTGAEGLLRGATLKPGTKVGVTVTAVDSVGGKIDLALARKPQILKDGSPPAPSHWRVTHWKKREAKRSPPSGRKR